MELAFEAIGDGPPVVLLHGLFASAASWRGVARALADTHRVLSVDLRNHGRSPRAMNMAYTEMADDVLSLIERESLGRAAVIGHSVGGKVAMALALSAPYAVGRLAVIDIAPAAYLDQWGQQLSARHDEHVDWRSHLPAIALSLPELCNFPGLLRYLRSDAALHAIVGARSPCVTPASAEAFAPMFPNASVEVIPDAGHWVHADQPHALVASLRRALATCH